MEEKKKETRGRKPTGRKLKQVAFKIDAELYDEIEAIAQEKSGISIHTFLKDNIKAFYDFSLKNKNDLRNTFFYYPTKETTEQIQFLCENKVYTPVEINREIDHLVFNFFYNEALLKKAEFLEAFVDDIRLVSHIKRESEHVAALCNYHKILNNLNKSKEISKLIAEKQEIELISYLQIIRNLKEMIEKEEGKENDKFIEFEKTLNMFVKNEYLLYRKY